MKNAELTRRKFLFKSSTGITSAWIASHLPEILAAGEHAHRAAASNKPEKFGFFTPEQAAEVEAIAAQIIPTDETPGAREAGVIHFIDRALSTFDRDRQQKYVKGLTGLERQARKLSPKARKFSELTSEQQIKLLKSIEKTDFFGLVRVHTVMGFLANPEYGGNRDRVGWKLLGFEDSFSFEPPFGFYDGEYKEGR